MGLNTKGLNMTPVRRAPASCVTRWRRWARSPIDLKPHGARDWNEFLQRAGQGKMTEAILRAAFPHRLPVAAQKPGESTFPPAGARVGDVWRRRQGTVTAYHGPDDDFPGGWVDLVTDDGQRGQADVQRLAVP